MKHRKWLIWCAAVVCALAVCVGVGREVWLNRAQDAMLEKLEEQAGEYDARSIVLSGTNVGRANELAERFSAQLRITEDGSFATLTLPEGVTIWDVAADKENRALLDELSVDYHASITDVTEDAAQVSHRHGHHHHGRPRHTVEDEGFDLQSYLDYMNLDTVWSNTQGSGMLVAVIDTGIDTDHPEFDGRISSYSYNATEDKVVKDYDWSLVEDEQGHGTAVAGVIAAAMDGSGTVGLAPQAELLVIKAECDENGTFYRTSDLVFGLYYAVERGADVVNMSFGTISDVFGDAARLAYDSDILCVAAAGNEATTQLTYPAADEHVIGVGALAEDSWELADYSNYGDNVNVVAPGTVYTSLMGGEYGVMTGTSFSAPAAAGALALYTSQNRYQTVDAVTEVLYASCADLGGLGEDWLYGYGAVDVSAMVLEEKGTVTFMMQTDELDDTEQLFVRDHTLQDIPEPERLYAVFDGWYYDPQCTEEYQWYEDVFSADLTLYAKWANEDDSVPYTYVTLADGTVEIRSYTGHRRYITVPDAIDGKTVSSIGMSAFEGEDRLRQVNLPRQLKTIGERAFMGCTNLMEIHIPDTVQSIGSRAFYANTRLSAVELGSGLRSLGDFAFSGCVSLTRFEVSENLTDMDGSALFGTTSLQSIGVRSGNTGFAAKDGVLFDKSGATLVAYPAGKSGSYTVPGSVKTVGGYAFGYARAAGVDLNGVQRVGKGAFMNSKLTKVVIPDGVTDLGSEAFSGSSLLRSVELGTGLAGISPACFAGCAVLNDVEIPANITSIESGAFANCSSLTRVTFAGDSALRAIGSGAFSNASIVSIEIPASVAVIDDAAFASCTALEWVTFAAGSVLSTIGDGAFASTVSLTQVELPGNLRILGGYAFQESALTDVEIPASLTYFGAGAFASCHGLTRIDVAAGNANYLSADGIVYDIHMETLVAYPAGKEAASLVVPDSVRTVGKAAVYGAHKLTSVTLPGSVKVLDEYSFYDCRNVTRYTVAEGLEDVNSYALSCNSSLRSFAVPDSVRLISRYAFAEDYALTTVTIGEGTELDRLGYAAFAMTGLTSFRVPANVSTMAQGVFEDCPSLYSITFAAGSKLDAVAAYTFDGCENLQSIVFEPGSALTTLSAHCFEGLTRLNSVDFGDAKLTEIGNYAFRFCESLTTLTVPDTLVNIGRFAFYGCDSLGTLTVPAGLEHIGSYAFHGAENLDLYFTADFLPLYLDENWDNDLRSYHVGVREVAVSGDWEYALLNSGNVSIIGYTGSASTVDLTGLDLGGDIVGIGGHAFYQSAVTEVILPDTLTTVQAYAFAQSALERVTIPASVDFVGRNAFAYSDVTSVEFESGSRLRVMEQEAFANTEKLTEITLPRSLTTLGDRVFFESGLRNVIFESGIGLTEIPEQAFAGSALTSVIIPDSVTKIDHSAFRDCLSLTAMTLGSGEDLYIASNVFYNTALTAVHIPANVDYIGEYTFVGLRELEDFTVSAENRWYTAVDGLLMSRDGRKLIAVPAGRTGTLTVPASVEEIGFGAFENSGLSAVKFHPDGNILTLGYRAFYGAEKLTDITIPASVVSIDYYAFANCTALERVAFAAGSRLTGVYEGAFYGCANLSDITLPDSIVEISEFAFYGCRALDRVPVENVENLLGIYDYAFACSGISGDFTTPEHLIDIGAYAFMGTDITTLTVPDTRQKELIIGIGAFEGCGKLTEVTLPFIGASIEDPDFSWFGYIFGAGSYEANDTYVPDSLKTVTISEGITTLPAGSFSNLPGLERINLPHSVVTVDLDAFTETTAEFELTNEVFLTGSAYNRRHATNRELGLKGHLSIAKGVTTIGGYAFAYAPNLISASIPDTVASIRENAFGLCEQLKTVEIPDSVEIIGSYAFGSCYCLTEVKLGSGLTSLAADAFNGANVHYVTNNSSLDLVPGSSDYGWLTSKAKLIIDRNGNKLYQEDGANVAFVDTPDGFRFMLEDGSYTLVAYLGEDDSVTLPQNINGQEYRIYKFGGVKHIIIPEGRTSIEDNAFYCGYSSVLESIVIPDSVTAIGAYAFYGCDSLKKVGLSASSKLESIGEYGFSGCDALETLALPDGLKRIDEFAFASQSGLKHLVLPDSVTWLGYRAFDGSAALESVQLSESLGKINTYTFQNCTSLKSIRIPASVKTIASESFAGCTVLEQVTLESGLQKIDSYAFEGCSALKEIAIPETVTELAATAFNGCTSLHKFEISPENKVYRTDGKLVFSADGSTFKFALPSLSGVYTVPDTMTAIPASAFSGCEQLTRVIVPEGVVNIGDGAFSGCMNLKEVILPESLNSIGKSAFYDCRNLKLISIPSAVASIGEGAFCSCRSIEKIVLPEGIEEIPNRAFSDCNSLMSVNIPESVKTIGYSAFSFCYRLTEVEIPDSVTELGGYAFYGCKSLQRAVLGDGITQLPVYLFYDCGILNELVIGTGVTAVEDYVFSYSTGNGKKNADNKLYVIHNNSSLDLTPGSEDFGLLAANARVIINKDGTKEYAAGYEGYAYYDDPEGFRYSLHNGKYELLCYLGGKEDVTLPLAVNGNSYDIAGLHGCINLTIPEGFGEIGYSAASGSRTLKSVVIEENISKMGNSAFSGCPYLESVTIGEGMSEIGRSAFRNCERLTEIVLPDSLVKINTGILQGSAYAEDPANWKNGMLCVGKHLIDVEEDVVFCDGYGGGAIAADALKGAYLLEQFTVCGDAEYCLSDLSNLEVLSIEKMPTSNVLKYFGSNSSALPLTLDTVVIKSGVVVKSETAFSGMSGITIFVEDNWIDSGAAWDVSCPGWNNGNKVYYGDEWITACFYDVNGDILEREFLLTSQIVRQPYYAIASDEMYDYTVVGWDIDGDGLTDHIPATSAVDIEAHPVVEKSPRRYTVTFYGKDGVTPVHVDLLPYGAAVTLPADPEKQGYEFLGWAGDVAGMTVTGDLSIFSRWQHVGDGHDYSLTEVLAPGCTEYGGTLHICSLCGESYLTDHTAPAGHSYTVTTVHGCDEPGYDLHTCTVCGDSWRDNFAPAAGHEFGDWSVDTEATCETDGLRSRTCAHCGDTEREVIPALPHQVTTVETKPATCTEEGERVHTCTDCGEVTVETVPVTAHNYERREVSMSFIEQLIRMIVNILWGYDGDTAYYYICSDCGHIQTLGKAEAYSAVSAAGCTHTDAAWTVAVEGNCLQQGVEWRVCALCDEVMEARVFGSAGEHGFVPEHVDHEGHRVVCSGCGLVNEGAHEWDEENRCTVCHAAGVSAVWSDNAVTVTVYHLPEGAARVLAVAYAEDGRFMECRVVTVANGAAGVVLDREGMFEVKLFVLSERWTPVSSSITAE